MRRAAFFIGVLVALVLPSGAFAAGHDPTGPPGNDDSARAASDPAAMAWGASAEVAASMSAQSALIDAATRIDAALNGLAGYIGVELGSDAVVLRWKGRPSSKVNAAITRLAGSVPVRVVSGEYSRAELRAAAEKIRREIEAGRGNGVHGILTRPDGSGLDLAVDATAGATPSRTTGDALATAAQQSAARSTATSAGVTVDTAAVVRPRMKPYSRQNDWAPWAGGIVISDRTSGSPYYLQGCSGGFGVISANDSRHFMVTASHCGYLADTVTDPTGEVMGPIWWRDDDQGVELIRVPAGVSGEIYVGAGTSQPSGTQGIKNVGAWTDSYKNESVCTSGAVTGNLCGLTVFNVEGYMCSPTPDSLFKCWGPLAGLQLSGTGKAGLPGDSGGPVYITVNSKATILGIIIGGDDAQILWTVTSSRINQSFDGVNDPKDLNLYVATR